MNSLAYASRLDASVNKLPDLFIIGDSRWCKSSSILRRVEGVEENNQVHEVHVLFNGYKDFTGERNIEFGVLNHTASDFQIAINALPGDKMLGRYVVRKGATSRIKRPADRNEKMLVLLNQNVYTKSNCEKSKDEKLSHADACNFEILASPGNVIENHSRQFGTNSVGRRFRNLQTDGFGFDTVDSVEKNQIYHTKVGYGGETRQSFKDVRFIVDDQSVTGISRLYRIVVLLTILDELAPAAF